MKVLILSGVKWDSIWSHAHELSRILSEEGYSVIFLDPPEVTTGTQPHLKILSKRPRGNVKVIENKSVKKLGPAFLLIYEVTAIKTILKENPDLIIFYGVLPGFATFSLAKLLRKKVIFMYVDDHRELLTNKIAKIFASIAIPIFIGWANGVISTAKVLHEESMRNKRAFYIPNGINIRDFLHTKRIPRTVKNVYFIGTLGKWIRLEDFITLADAGFNVFVIGHGEKFEELKNATKNRRNITLYGYLDRKAALNEISEKCDIGIIPFLKNKLTDAISPIKLFEFVALNKPVLATNTIELESFKGIILVYSTTDELKKNALFLKANPKLIKEIVKKNRKILKHYDWGSHLKKRILGAIRIIAGEEI
ncbi:glycosyltransferase [Pyrococcus kukulkanii]|uniref:Glycosyltransferase n=1 Tax=Pyrococcus kukulkanii TaxID=1609559 RepID=A0ABV4T6W1_9EURY